MFTFDLYAFFIYLNLGLLVSLIAFLISFLFGIKSDDSNKLSSYECGYSPFHDARNTFTIHFYLIAIIFLMTDLVISYLYPWSVSLSNISLTGYCQMILFISLFGISLTYEFKKGALEWE